MGSFSSLPQYSLNLSVWLINQDTVNNRSLVGWSLSIYKGSGTGYFTGNSGSPWSVSGSISGSGNFAPYDFRNGSSTGTWTIGSGTNYIAHNADGTAPSQSYSATANDSAGGNLGSASASASALTIPTIPRATVPTVSPTSVNAGSAVTINLPRASTSFTHDITYSFGALTGQTSGLAASTGVATSTTFTPPLALLNQIPNAVSAVATITVVTKNGATVIGTNTVNLTVSAPSTVRPTISSLSISEATTVPDVATIVGAYVQNISKLNVGIVGEAGAYGSSIVSYKITVAGQTINAVSGTTPAPINASGTVNVAAEVTDSRGRTSAFAGTNISVLAYNVPQITAITVQRSDVGGTVDNSAGTYIRVDMTAAVQSLIVGTQKNELHYRVYTSPQGANTWTQRGTEVDVNALTFNSSFVITAGAPYAITNSFDVRIDVLDMLDTITPIIRTISTGAVVLDLDGANGVGVGKYRQNGRLDIQGDTYTSGAFYANSVDVRRVATTSVNGVTTLATNAETQAGTVSTKAVTPASLASRTATDTRAGIVELATDAETQTGTDTARAVTPASMTSALLLPGRVALRRITPASVAKAGGGTVVVLADGTARVTASGAGAISLNGVLALGKNYMIDIIALTSSNGNNQFRFRKAGTDQTGTNYVFGGTYSSGALGAAGAVGGYSAIANAALLSVNGLNVARTQIKLLNNDARSGIYYSYSTATRDGSSYSQFDAGGDLTSGVLDSDGFTIIPGAGTFDLNTEIKVWEMG